VAITEKKLLQGPLGLVSALLFQPKVICASDKFVHVIRFCCSSITHVRDMVFMYCSCKQKRRI